MEQEKFKFRWFKLLEIFFAQALCSYNHACELMGEDIPKVSPEKGTALFLEHFLAEYCGGDEEKMVRYYNLEIESIFPTHFLLGFFHQLISERTEQIIKREEQLFSVDFVIKTVCEIVFKCFNPDCDDRDQIPLEYREAVEGGIVQPESTVVPIAEDFSFILWIDKSSMANFLQALWNVREHFNQLRPPFSEMAAELAAPN